MSFTTDRALLQEPLAPLMCFLLEDPPTVCSCTPAQTDGCMPGALPTALRRMSLGLDQNGPITPLLGLAPGALLALSCVAALYKTPPKSTCFLPISSPALAGRKRFPVLHK